MMLNGNCDSFSFLMNKKVLVTGGTGFVGRHLMPMLLAAGAEVTCLVRESSDTSVLPRNVAVVHADLLTGNGLDEAVAGKDIVIHMAALLFGLYRQDYFKNNSAMARSFAESLRRLRLSGDLKDGFRFVLVSSMAATGPCGEAPGVSDSDGASPVSSYGWSKLLVEEILGRELGDALTVIRPPIIYGSGDRGLLPMFRGEKMRFAFCPGWRRQFYVSAVHVDDLSRAVLLLCRGDARGVYHVSDGNIYTIDEFYTAMGMAVNRVCGRNENSKIFIFHLPVPVIFLSALAVTVSASVADILLRRLTGHGIRRVPQWNFDKYQEAKQTGWICNGNRICSELGFVPKINLRDGMKEAAEGYRSDGWL